MTGAELLAEAEKLKVNPWCLGYAIATGGASAKEVFDRDRGAWGYSQWNHAIWIEQAKAEGYRGSDGLDFCAADPVQRRKHSDYVAAKLTDAMVAAWRAKQ